MRSHVSDRNGSARPVRSAAICCCQRTREIDTLRRIAVSVKRLAAADVVSVVIPLLRGESELEVVTAVGIGQEDLTGLRYPPADSIAWRAMQECRGLIVQDVDRQSGGVPALKARPCP